MSQSGNSPMEPEAEGDCCIGGETCCCIAAGLKAIVAASGMEDCGGAGAIDSG
jgi:hypothetical protein